ncbi:MAG: aspartate kinase [Candidatus Aenigmatarchaeota archaeon]
MTIVHKFGGGIIRDGSGLADIEMVTRSYDVPQLIVVSALKGVTNELREYLERDEPNIARSTIVNYALTGRDWIKGNNERDSFLRKLKDLQEELLDPELKVDEVLSFGERLSTEFCYHALKSRGIDVGKVNYDRYHPLDFSIICSEHKEDADPILEKTKNNFGLVKEKMEEHDVVVLPGFIGVTELGELRTLGRGGSDTTALASAYALDVNEVNLWKDTKGVRTADPGIVKNTRLIPHISYSEANNMTKSGAKIVQHKSSKLAEETGIKMRIPYIKDSSIFTVINGERRAEEPLVKYVGGTDSAKMISCSFDEFLEIREECQKQNQQDDFFILHGNYNNLRVLILNNKNNIHKGKKVGVATLVGDRLKETKGVLERASHQLREQKINIIDYGSGGEEELYMSFILKDTLTKPSIRALHKKFIEEDTFWKNRN